MIALPFPFRTYNGIAYAECWGCHRWRPWDKGHLVNHHAAGLPLGWPLGFKVWVCSARCEGAAL